MRTLNKPINSRREWKECTPPTWSDVHELLTGLGPAEVTMEDANRRFILPAAFRSHAGLDALLRQPWLITYRSAQTLAVVLRFLWPDYLKHLQAELGLRSATLPKFLHTTVVAPAKNLSMDQRHRWQLPDHLYEYLDLKENFRTLVIRPCQAWLEILPRYLFVEENRTAAAAATEFMAARLNPVAPQASHITLADPMAPAQQAVHIHGVKNTGPDGARGKAQ